MSGTPLFPVPSAVDVVTLGEKVVLRLCLGSAFAAGIAPFVVIRRGVLRACVYFDSVEK